MFQDKQQVDPNIYAVKWYMQCYLDRVCSHITLFCIVHDILIEATCVASFDINFYGRRALALVV